MTQMKPVLPRMRMIYTTLCAAFILICLTTVSFAQGYGVRPGDSLRIEVLEDPSLNRTVLVAPDGRISVPSAGTLRVRGMTVDTIERNLTQRLSGNFASEPNVFVGLQAIAEPKPVAPRGPVAPQTISIFVMGESNRPGKIEVEPGTTMLQMFAEMGGFTKFAAIKRIQLRRTDPRSKKETIFRLNYRAIEEGGAGSKTVMQDGDVIVVPQRRLFE
jgi:polysaccharide export outer membrane protein